MDAEARPFPHFTLQVDKPPVFMDDLIADGHSQTISIRPGGKKGVENPLKVFLGNPNARIRKNDLDLVSISIL